MNSKIIKHKNECYNFNLAVIKIVFKLLFNEVINIFPFLQPHLSSSIQNAFIYEIALHNIKFYFI